MSTKLRVIFFTHDSLYSARILTELLQIPTIELVGVVTSTTIMRRNKFFINDGVRLLFTSGVRYTLYLLKATVFYSSIARHFSLQTLSTLLKEHRIPLIKSNDVNTPRIRVFLDKHAPDLCISAYFNQWIMTDLLSVPARGFINLHPSLLPKNRGVDPVFYACLRGEKHGGVTVHVIDSTLDTGQILLQAPVAIDLQQSLLLNQWNHFDQGARLLRDVLLQIDNYLPGTPQVGIGNYDGWPRKKWVKMITKLSDWDAPLSPHVLITGATGGLGYALALEYASEGCHLSLIGRNNIVLQQLKEGCEQKGATVNCYRLDVLDLAAMSELLTIIDNNHPITLAIANAGITSFIENDHLVESMDQIHKVIDTNLTATLNLITLIIDFMQKRKTGQIAIISSLAAYRGLPMTPSYCASKAAIKVYGDAIRPLLKKQNICLSVICPGFISTHMSEQYPCKKPCILTPSKAALLIAKGLKKKKGNISFPRPLVFGSWLLSILPSWFSDIIVMRNKLCHRSEKNVTEKH